MGNEIENVDNVLLHQALPKLWEKLKPLARQMRSEPTPAEVALWERLRGRKVAGCKFRRQHAIGKFIVDFYCLEKQLVVEVDGPIHEYTQEEDAVRQEFLESLGLKVVRVSNDEVFGGMEGGIGGIVGKLGGWKNLT